MSAPTAQKRRRCDGVILLSLPGRVLRADWSRGGGGIWVEGLWPGADDGLSTPEEIVAFAEGLAGPLPQQALVLASTARTQTLELPGGGANRSDAEWQLALSEEMSALSGIAAFDSVLAFVRLPMQDGQRRFWATQLPQGEFAEWEEALHRSGCRRISIAHPGGMAMESAAARGALPCAEYWPETILCQDREEDRRQVEIVPGDPIDGPARAQARVWIDLRPGHSPMLFRGEGGHSPALAEGMSALSLDDPAVAAEWMAHWAAAANAPIPRTSVPLIVAPKRPLPLKVKMMLTAAAAVLLLSIGAHFLWTQQRIAAATGQLARLSGPREELRQYSQRIAKATEERKKVEQEVEEYRGKVSGALWTLEQQGGRVALLLPTFAEAFGRDTVLAEISHEGDATQVQGLSSSPEAADRVRGRLLERLAPAGWRVD